jgi:hypothetical protein
MEIYTFLARYPVETDSYGRNFIVHNGSRFLVPRAAVPDYDCDSWTCHDRHRIAVPGKLALHSPIARYKGPHADEGGTTILTVAAESLACAQLMAAACGIRIFGWDTGCSHDCSGRTFASEAESFIIREDAFREPGNRQQCRIYGFMVSWSIDV